jgi:hypothetical protein
MLAPPPPRRIDALSLIAILSLLLLGHQIVHGQTYFRARGSAHEVGVQYGRHFQKELHDVWRFKTHHQHAKVLDQWKRILPAAQSAIETHAPLYWQELQGVAQGSGMALDQLLLLATEYEAEMMTLDASNSTKSSKGCTGFALPTSGWIGQTNDDHPTNWANGSWDVVLHLEMEELDFSPILLYSHVGVPAYLGMNAAAGLGFTWYYIDDASRNFYHGLPTTVLIRQLLYERSLNDTLGFLQTVPKTVPNAFLILDAPNQQAVSVEVSSTEYSTMESSSSPLVHANHVLHSARMWQHEVRVETFDVGHKSVDRYRVLNELLWRQHHNMDMTTNTDDLFQLLNTPPIHNHETLATVVMNAFRGCFHIQFYNQTTPLEFCLKNDTVATTA